MNKLKQTIKAMTNQLRFLYQVLTKLNFLLGLTIPQGAQKKIEKPTTFPGLSKETNKKLVKLKKTDTMEQNRVIEEITLPPISRSLTDLKTIFEVGHTGINEQVLPIRTYNTNCSLE